jgi:hypothetical protein
MNEKFSENERITKVVNSFGGILPCTEVCYIISIIYSSQACLNCFSRYESLLPRKNLPEIISSLQQALSYAAEISRFFWPSYTKEKNMNPLAKARGKKLRNAFSVKDDSPLSNRALRNYFEHLDEHMDSFFLSDNSFGIWIPYSFMDTANKEQGVQTHYFKMVDPQNEKMILFDTEFSFSEIKAEVERIDNFAHQFYENGGRLPREV